MCGIVAAVARRNVVPILLEGLRRLEYRGYDSAGVAVIDGSFEGKMRRLRSCGRVAELKKLADEQQLEGMIGIGHTRWATHGVPSERNAHPHVSGGISVVHNGIIENHDAIRARLRACCTAASVSAVSPDCEIATTSRDGSFAPITAMAASSGEMRIRMSVASTRSETRFTMPFTP